MSWLRAIVCIVMPPVAVLDHSPRAVAVTLVLTLLGWLPGIAAALVYNSSEPTPRDFIQNTDAL